ncbi:uncharacterized protein UV8b_00246 [Ustilaginoidea virens]|uniref:Uncharacterized protein n=1 Tax=Ustilaginoidea virens TaxID=1159556 RepID=A0A063C0V3_USTVR|nr:uncharacterized protein UV8b_00246 [Ustilaginoidea virens]ARS01304.1 hypothetical protein [Ustilaginoidea virens]QUC16005.1 hypothetical protein UV8b_00246 [Ustilaginoidea virens]GAO16395.1 hypothetical protein UVI_02049520 [Ustilaginoidea virens]
MPQHTRTALRPWSVRVDTPEDPLFARLEAAEPPARAHAHDTMSMSQQVSRPRPTGAFNESAYGASVSDDDWPEHALLRPASRASDRYAGEPCAPAPPRWRRYWPLGPLLALFGGRNRHRSRDAFPDRWSLDPEVQARPRRRSFIRRALAYLHQLLCSPTVTVYRADAGASHRHRKMPPYRWRDMPAARKTWRSWAPPGRSPLSQMMSQSANLTDATGKSTS